MQPVPELRADVDVQSIPEPTADELDCESEDVQTVLDCESEDVQPVPEPRADVDVQSIPEPTGDVELA